MGSEAQARQADGEPAACRQAWAPDGSGPGEAAPRPPNGAPVLRPPNEAPVLRPPNGASVRAAAPLRVLHDTKTGIDLAAAERAAAQFLRALGVELTSESLRATPGRMARAYAELFTPLPFDVTTFPNDAGYDELVLARAIPVRSVCEHHLLPFTGVAHVGYLPGQRILGLSKLARIVGHFARRPQVQERLTRQIADCLDACLRPLGAGVVIEAEHTCMTMRGVQATGSRTVTSALLGSLRVDPRSRQEFFALAGAGA